MQALVRPIKSLRSKPKIWHKIVIAWSAAFVLATPQLFIFLQVDDVTASGYVRQLCVSRGYNAPWQRKVYFSFMALYILVIPTCIMTFSYVKIIRVVFTRAGAKANQPRLTFRARSTTVRTSEKSATVTSHAKDTVGQNCLKHCTAVASSTQVKIPKKLISSSKRKVVKMTLSVIIAFIVCWSPYFVVGLIRIYSEYAIPLDDIFALTELMAMLHSVLNPIICGAFSTRSAIKSVRTSYLRRRKPENIVVNISVGSDFDSLVFVTHPEVYTGKASVDDKARKSRRCACVNIVQKMCRLMCSGRGDPGVKGSGGYRAVSVRDNKTRHTSNGSSSIRSLDSRYTSVRNTQTTSLPSYYVASDRQQRNN